MAREPKRMTRVVFILNCIVTTVFFPLIVLALAGDWGWPEGWLFGLWFDAMLVFNMSYLYFKDPALLAERSKAPGSDNQKGWDKYLLTATYLLAIGWLIIQPLDAKRFAWSPAFPLWLKIVGGLALLPALYLIERTTIENTFLSTMVRIQDERQHRVITTGVYSFVRHPLYLGCLLMMLGAPLLMGSLGGILITLVGATALLVRIVGEERLLTAELEGYADYKREVKYRLIPFIW